MHKARLNRVVDETTKGYGLGAKRLGEKWYWRAKRLRVKIEAKRPRAKRLGGETSCYQSEYFTGDISIDIHSPTIVKTSL